MKKKTITLIPILLILIIPFLLFLTNFNIILFNEGTYKNEFQKHNVYNKFPEADNINSDVLGYFKNNDKLIQNDFFNEREKQHLLDVKNIISKLLSFYHFLLIFFIVLILILAFISKKKITSYLLLISIFSGLLTFTLFLIFFLAIKLNFSNTFTSFHEIFFPQGNWMFNPAVDRITTLYPAPFFYDMAQKIAMDTLFWALIMVLSGLLFIIIANNKIFKPTK